jgi:hypothetical protein
MSTERDDDAATASLDDSALRASERRRAVSAPTMHDMRVRR